MDKHVPRELHTEANPGIFPKDIINCIFSPEDNKDHRFCEGLASESPVISAVKHAYTGTL